MVAMSTPDDDGYWLCRFRRRGVQLRRRGVPRIDGRRDDCRRPIVGVAACGAGGYWLAGSDGGVFAFGDANSTGRWPVGTSFRR